MIYKKSGGFFEPVCRKGFVWMKVSDFYYDLPEKLIAQHPAENRDESRLMVLDKKTGEIRHRHFYDIIEYLNYETPRYRRGS